VTPVESVTGFIACIIAAMRMGWDGAGMTPDHRL
jgi:hypothetical protein